MALSQAQKKFIELISTDPKQAFDTILKKEIDLESFKEGFYKDGTGLIYKLINCVIMQRDIYLPIIEYVLKHSSLSLEDKAKGKDSPIGFFISCNAEYLKNENITSKKHVVEDLFHLLEANKGKNESSTLYKGLIALKTHNFDELYQKLLLQFEEITRTPVQTLVNVNDLVKIQKWVNFGMSNSTDLLRLLIKKDDLSSLKQWFQISPGSVEHLKTHNFFVADQRSVLKTNSLTNSVQWQKQSESSNALIYAMHHKAKDISNYFIEQNICYLNGTIPAQSINMNYTAVQGKEKSVPALVQAACNNDYELFEKVFYLIPQKDLVTILVERQTISDPDNESLFQSIVEHEDKRYLDLITKNAKDIILSDKNPLNIVYEIISLNSSFADIEKLLKVFLPYYHQDNDKIYSVYDTFANRFFNNIYGRNTYETEDYPIISKCLNLLKDYNILLYNAQYAFDNKIFSNELLFDSIVAGGIDLKNDDHQYPTNGKKENRPINLFLLALNKNKDIFYNEKEVIFNKNVLQKIHDSIGDNLFINHYERTCNLIETCIFQDNYAVLDILSDSDLKKLVDDIPRFIPKSFLLKDKQSFEKFIQRCINLDIVFLNQNIVDETAQIKLVQDDIYSDSMFYLLMKNNINIHLLDQILKKENETIESLSAKSNFWDAIAHEEIAQYAANNKANYDCSEHLHSLCYAMSQKPLELYLKYGGSIDYKHNDGGSIIHALIKDSQYEQANTILDYYPHLATTVNNHNKFAVSYLLEDLNKACKKSSDKQSRFTKEAFNQSLIFVHSVFASGLESKSKKPVEFLQSQLVKYNAIFEHDPDLKTLLNYSLLDKKITQQVGVANTTYVKKKKI